MAVQIGAKPDSGFDDPLGMLADCHRRIERFLSILCGVAQRAQGRPLSGEEHEAIEAALGYFREAGPRHNRDEEDSVFPRLRERGADEVLDKMSRLESEHSEASALHDEMARLYSRWIADGHLSTGDELRIKSIATRLLDIYREHIRIEEEIVFPCAARLIAPPELAAIGAEFKARREHGG
jgi:hemerythrin-like domain-containing protein